MRANDGRFQGRFGARFGGRFGPMQIVEGSLLGALGIALLVACSSSTQPPMKSIDQRPDGGAALDGGGDATVSDASGSEVADVSASEASMESSADDAEFVYPTNLDAGSDAALPPPVPQSCLTPGPGVSDCGPDAGSSCCAGSILPEGNVLRSYDGTTPQHTSTAFPAAVASLWLDQYEVTVGRFRPFVNAVVGGWLPEDAEGKHVHLNIGAGLAAAGAADTDGSSTDPYESGWQTAWNANLLTTADAWNTALACDARTANWTSTPGANEHLPANCMTWYEAYAFCIWDGGFLPSEAEWNYAASGGGDQRVYPWSNPASSATIDCSYANYHGADMDSDYCVAPGLGATNAVGSESPAGDGKWGQSDLAGNVFEWNLDYYAPYVSPCSNCAYLATTATSARVIRGGAFGNAAAFLLSSARNSNDPLGRTSSLGTRCARPP
jgi:formylglycine-generating enzyme required for sulfatase activity